MINYNTFKKLAATLDENNIVWGIGGSFLLQLHGLYSNPNDLDIWVQTDDISKLKTIFSSFDEIESSIQLPPQYHFKMQYYDTEVDFISCFITIPNQKRFEYHILPTNIEYIEFEDGIKVPCTLLENWYIVYKLLNRKDKAQIIEDVFIQKKLELSIDAINESLNDSRNHMQKRVRTDVKKLVSQSQQYSLFDSSGLVGIENEEKTPSPIEANLNK